MTQPFALSAAAADLYADLPLSSVLRQLLRHSNRLLGSMAGSVSLIDPARERYVKMAEYGASCQLGRTFPLAEGVTGQVMARRAPVVLASYGAVPSGHLPTAHPASAGAVAAVPIWWRGDVIGANVSFAGRLRRFTGVEVDQLELLTQLAAAGIVSSAAARSGRVPETLTEPTAGRPVDRSPFTPRERQVLGLLSVGMSDYEAAQALSISPKTVEKHVGALLRKTGTSRRAAAVVAAVEHGWLVLAAAV